MDFWTIEIKTKFKEKAILGMSNINYGANKKRLLALADFSCIR